LSETSATSAWRAQVSASAIRNSINPFGVSPRRRMELSE